MQLKWLAKIFVSFEMLVYFCVNDCVYRYNIFLMMVNYFVPLGILTVTYVRVGIELWGSQTIGEYTARQEENVRSKRKVKYHIRNICRTTQNKTIYYNKNQ